MQPINFSKPGWAGHVMKNFLIPEVNATFMNTKSKYMLKPENFCLLNSESF